SGIDPHTAVGEQDIFLTKINADGTYGWTITMGGTAGDFGQSVTTDSYGNVYITGYFSGTDVDFDPGSGIDPHTAVGEQDIFLTKFDSDGNYLFTKTMGGTAGDFGQSVALDGNGNVYITGYFSGTDVDFDPGAGTDYHTSKGYEDIFITRINFEGSYDVTATMGGTNHDYGQSVAVNSSDNVYITGSYSGTNVDLNPGTGTDYHTSKGDEDIFLTKFRLVGFVVTPTSVTTNGAGDEASFTVRLLSEPSANGEPFVEVILPVSSSDLTVGTVDKSTLTFTDSNWYEDQTITVTSLVSSSQTYKIILAEANSADTDYDGLNPTDVTVKNVGSDSEGSGCFIATAAYGSSMEPHVKIMRQFRDRFLIGNTVGKIFVHLYYTYSPPIADFIAKHDSLRILVRMSLFPVVGLSWIVLKVGPVLTLAFMLFFISCFMGIIWFRRRYKE
ncbi:MAG: CFI-box-CTERM domain-containing protein, partial [Desulfobacterales bacterium]